MGVPTCGLSGCSRATWRNARRCERHFKEGYYCLRDGCWEERLPTSMFCTSHEEQAQNLYGKKRSEEQILAFLTGQKK
jgi:hypothetical protein